MFGPFDFFNNTPFDLNDDGKIDPSEQAFIMDALYSDDEDADMDDDDMGLEDTLIEAGIDADEFESMDYIEKYQALEDAGLDPDDFEDF